MTELETRNDNALRALKDAGYIVSDYHNDSDPNNRKRSDRYFVGAGSHGKSHATLRGAMIGCMRCCNIQRFWKNQNGVPMAETFDRIARDYLGGPL